MRIRLTCLLTTILALHGCGKGSSNSTSTPTPASSLASSSASSSVATQTTYTVDLSPNSNNAIPHLQDPLNANHFAVVVVDVAGKITEKTELKASDITQDTNGTWSLTLNGSLRADRLVIVDINSAATLAVGDSIHQEDLAYAPTTATYISIDIGSTAAYNSFLSALGGQGSFDSKNIYAMDGGTIAAVGNMINNVQDLTDNEFDPSTQSLTIALQELAPKLVPVMAQEILNIKHPAAGTAVNLVRDEGGMFSYDAQHSGDISYDAYIGMADPLRYFYNGSVFTTIPPSTVTDEPDYLLLVDEGWSILESDSFNIKASSYNNDQSATFQSTNLASYKITLNTDQVIDLAGRNIRDFASSELNLLGLTDLLNADALFASGAKGYRHKYSFKPYYTLTIDTETDGQGKCSAYTAPQNVSLLDMGGNCNASTLHTSDINQDQPLTDITKIYSPDVGVEDANFKAVSLFSYYFIQFVDNKAKTVRAYYKDEDDKLILSGTGTWASITLPYLTQDAAAVEFQLNHTEKNATAFLTSGFKFVLVKQNGFVRPAYYIDNSNVKNAYSGIAFNAAANNSIVNALSKNSSFQVSPAKKPQKTSLTAPRLIR